MGAVTEVTFGTEPIGTSVQNIAQILNAHGPLIDEFAGAWYRGPYTWSSTHVLGANVMKCPMDLWIYHELLWRTRPVTVLETGTAMGGSALWFALLMDILQINGQVITIDTAPQLHPQAAAHPRILSIRGDSSDPAVAADVRARIVHPLLVTLDAEHSEEHVARELALYAPEVRVGEYLVVEDTNIGWDDDPGPWGALQTFLAAHPDEWYRDLYCERFWLTMHPHGWLRRIAEGPDGTGRGGAE